MRVKESQAKISPKAKQIKTKLKEAKRKAKSEEVDLAEIVTVVKNCEEAESIEKRILDRVSLVNRVLLPLYIVHEHMGNKFGLKTSEISKITTDLGIPVRNIEYSHAYSGSAITVCNRR